MFLYIYVRIYFFLNLLWTCIHTIGSLVMYVCVCIVCMSFFDERKTVYRDTNLEVTYTSYTSYSTLSALPKKVTKWRNLHLWVWAFWFCDFTWRVCHTSLTPSKPRQNFVLHFQKIYGFVSFFETETANKELMSNNWWKFVKHHTSLWANV